MKTIKLFIGALIITSMFAACSQEGPVGPTGPTGTTGPMATFDVTPGILAPTSWVPDSVANSNIYYSQLSDENIANYTEDEVIAYVQDTAGGTTDFNALPISNFPVANATLSYSYNNGLVTFYYQYTTGTTIPPAVSLNVKVVVVPYVTLAAHPGLNVHDYTAVMALIKQNSTNK